MDEALVAEVTELPRTRESLFKTTVTKNIEFKSYLQLEHKKWHMEEEHTYIVARGKMTPPVESNPSLHNL